MTLDGSEVTISSDASWFQAGMSRRTGRGLQAAQAILRERGFTAHPTAWASAAG